MKTIAKNTILTPISVVETKINQNLNVLKEFVEHNWPQLNVGAERGMEYEMSIMKQPNKVGCGSVEFHWTGNPEGFIKIYVNGSDPKSDWDFSACLTSIEKLRDYAENPRDRTKYDLQYNRL